MDQLEVTEAAVVLTKTNPSTGDVMSIFPPAREWEVETAVAAAADSFAGWVSLGPVRRGEIIYRLSALLDEQRSQLAAMIAAEHGKPMKDALGEVDRTVALVRFAASFGRRLGGRTLPSDTPNTHSSTTVRPVGPVALITPWNFPLAIPAWKLAPALVAGCTVVLKPSPLAPRTAQRLVELAEQAGVPIGVISVLQGDGATGELLVSHQDIAGVSFTGSVEVGRRIQSVAARSMTRTQLEMGGKNAVIVMDDADVERAAAAVVSGAFGQSGQRCSATSRVIVHRAVHEQLVASITARADALRLGPPDDPSSDLGPLISEDAMSRCLEAISRSVADGGRVLCGAERVQSPGYYVRPTVIDGLMPDAHLAQTEVFGPVLVVLTADSLDEAIAINNAVHYGMSATIFTRDLRAAAKFVEEAEAGMLHVNRPGTGAFAHMAHVGTKASQFGPAECSEQTFEFFLETRTVTVDVS